MSERAGLREQLMQAPVPMSIVRGPDFVYELANPLYEEMTGRKGIEGKPLRDAFPELGADDPVFRMLREVYATKRPFRAHELEVRVDRGAGPEPTFFDFTVQPMLDAEGNVEGAMTVAVDVTAQVRARRLAETGSARFALLARVGAVLEEAHDIQAGLRSLAALLVPILGDIATISLLDEEGIIHRLADDTSRPERAEMVSHARSQPVPEHMLPIVGEVMASARARVFHDYQREVLEALPADDPYRMAMRDIGTRAAIFAPLRARGRSLGYLTVALLSGTRVYDAGDVDFLEVVGYRAGLAVAHAQLLEREKAARAEAETANRLKDQFLATMGHELRTPLNAILGWAQVLTTPGMEARRDAALATIVRNARAQARLIDDLLDVARISSQKLAFEAKRVELSQLVAAAVESVKPAAVAREVTLVADIDRDVFVEGDATRLDQVVANLLSNAVKFSRAKGHVWVSLSGENGHAILAVNDDGEGIDPEFLPHIFDRFAQADSSSTRKHGGLGLGLAIAKSLVEMHGGTLSASSDGAGKGARFVVEVPLSE